MSEYITLIHAQWRNTWKIFAATMGFVVVFSLVGYLQVPPSDASTGALSDPIGFALGVIFIAQLFWVVLLLVSQDGDGRLTLEMPEYLLQLPISSWKLAAARMTFGISTCIVLSAFDTILYYALFDARFEEALPFIDGILSTVLGYVLLQPVIWWLGPGGFICTASFIVGVPALWSTAVLTSGFMRNVQNHIDHSLLAITSYDWLYIIPLMVGSFYLIGVAGIALHRKGRFSDLRMPTLSRKSAVSLESVPNETFSSPEEALRWLEYRQHWKLFPWLSVFLLPGMFFHFFGTDTMVGNDSACLRDFFDGGFFSVPCLATVREQNGVIPILPARDDLGTEHGALEIECNRPGVGNPAAGGNFRAVFILLCA
ncbi:MAG TPA: hypothetical protein EYO39_05355 [Nitrospirales bacterium]|nr:hypothetical protein [Nitrospirales bacterium]